TCGEGLLDLILPVLSWPDVCVIPYKHRNIAIGLEVHLNAVKPISIRMGVADENSVPHLFRELLVMIGHNLHAHALRNIVLRGVRTRNRPDLAHTAEIITVTAQAFLGGGAPGRDKIA